MKQRTVVLDVKFADRTMARPVLTALSGEPGVTVRVLRGRVTPRNAWYLLELAGDAGKVDKARTLLEDWVMPGRAAPMFA
jgi:hypothetical protein